MLMANLYTQPSTPANSLWQEDFWILVVQLYLQKPMGVKPMYGRSTVALSLELHIPPHFIHERMTELRDTRRQHLLKMMKRYAADRRRLDADAKVVRLLSGFFNPGEFYDGVQLNETFEADFRPIPRCPDLIPLALILVLDLYFRLTPITMVASTPEVKELARLIGTAPQRVVEVMDVYRIIDPYLNRNEEFTVSPLFSPCQKVWNRYGNDDVEQLAALAAELKQYYEVQ